MCWFGAIFKKSFIIPYTEALESNDLVTFAAWHNLSVAEDTALSQYDEDKNGLKLYCTTFIKMKWHAKLMNFQQ